MGIANRGIHFMVLNKLQDHYLVPKHERIPEEQKQEVLAQLGTELDRLPKVSRVDPMIEEIGAKRGDLIRIVRNSPTAGKSIYYRVVQ
jgi:DNA-directed RNA polymerase subunit H